MAMRRVGRPAAQTFIVNNVVPAADLLDENLSFRQFFHLTSSIGRCVSFAARRGLIANRMTCHRCLHHMSFVSERTVADRWRWHCRRCHLWFSIRHNSFFKLSHLSLQQSLTVVFLWSKEVRLSTVTEEVGMSED